MDAASDPASDAWLPEATLDPATRAWLTGAGRDRGRSVDVAPIPVTTPDPFAPRVSPTHVHGSGTGLGDWTNRPPVAPGARGNDDHEGSGRGGTARGPAASGDLASSDEMDDLEATRLRDGAGSDDAHPSAELPSSLPAMPVSSDEAVRQQHPGLPGAPTPPPVRPAPAAHVAPVVPAAPSWWIDRSPAPVADPAPDDTEANAGGLPAPATADGPAHLASAADSSDGAGAVPSSEETPETHDSSAGTAPAAPPSGADAATADGDASDGDRADGAAPDGAADVVDDATGRDPGDPGADHRTAHEHDAAQVDRDPDPGVDVESGVDAAIPPEADRGSTPPEALPAHPESAAVPARAGDTAVIPPFAERRTYSAPPSLVAPGTQPTACHICGHTMEPDDIFCEECGAVRPSVTAAFTGPVMPLPTIRPDWSVEASDEQDPAVHPEPDSAADASTPPELDTPDPVMQDPIAPGPDPVAPEPEPEPVGQGTSGSSSSDRPPASATVPSSVPSPPNAEAVPGAPFVPPLPPVPVEPQATSMDEWARARGLGEPIPSTISDSAASASSEIEDVEATRIVDRAPQRAPLILHFSTGERIGVQGSGLLGRLPRPEPGERFDELVTVLDPGKSVSKTHLEIGRDGDDLWVSDRFSGNGTVVRHIDGSIRRCEPGRRYRVERGARVDIGEQFFLVQ